MKDKILLFVIGVLVGGIIATGSFYVYAKVNSDSCETQIGSRQDGNPPSMSNGENGQPAGMSGRQFGDSTERNASKQNSSGVSGKNTGNWM